MNGTDTKTAGSGWGTGSVTLQGATVLAGWEHVTSNTWSNRFILEEGTVSSFGSSTNATGKVLTLSGGISGNGALSKTTAIRWFWPCNTYAEAPKPGRHLQLGDKSALGRERRPFTREERWI